MLMVIFGAGASYDSASQFPISAREHEARPPLTNKIFKIYERPWLGTLTERLKYIRPLSQFFHQLGKNIDLENDLEKWREERANQEVARRNLSALGFYLQEVLRHCSEGWIHLTRGVTNYLNLLEKIENWRASTKGQVVFVTFNYDTLLEEAFNDLLAVEFTNIQDYLARHDYKVFKPHGSINWGLQVESKMEVLSNDWTTLALQMIEQAAQKVLTLSTEYHVLSNPQKLWEVDKFYHPAIAIPLQSKAYFACPDTHVSTLQQLLPNVNKLLVIGWRATEHHFLKLWQGNVSGSIQGTIVNGKEEDGRIAQGNLERYGLRRVFPLDEGFSTFVAGDGITQFLGA